MLRVELYGVMLMLAHSNFLLVEVAD